MIDYAFNEGDYVYCRVTNQYGQVICRVPGNGLIPWYFVQFDDGTEDRFTKEDLQLQ